jgi:hypothetical protein
MKSLLPNVGAIRRIGTKAGAGLAVALAVALCGCAGARQLVDGHLAYNEAVRRASDQELLLNMVRLRYHDSLEFLSISSINSTLSFSVGIDASGARVGGSGTAGAGVSTRYSSTPTFSFVPQRGGEFAHRLTEPVDVATLVFLASANRDAHQIFRLLVTWMNGLDNQEGRVDAEFIETTRILTELQFRGQALMGFREEETVVSPPVPVAEVGAPAILQALGDGFGIRRQPDDRIVFTRRQNRATLFIGDGVPDRDRLLATLRLDPGRAEYPIVQAARLSHDGPGETLSLQTRSLLHGMAFLSQGIDVPAEHLAAGVASPGWPHSSLESVPMDDLFRIWHSKEEPEDASVAVRHRGYWFYVRDDDATSKRTFFLITEVFRLTLTHDASAAPVLTLPVGVG